MLLFFNLLTEIYVPDPKLIKAALKRGSTNVTRLTSKLKFREQWKNHNKTFIEAQKEKRNNVITVVKNLNANIQIAAKRSGDEWAMKINQRISGN